jgi:tripartite-type tricarboxylate transporter receptor subunit TctC
VAAAATPRPIVRRLAAEMQKALAHPEVVSRLEKMGTLITPMPAEEMDAFIAQENSRWARVIAQRNIKPLT